MYYTQVKNEMVQKLQEVNDVQNSEVQQSFKRT